MVGHQALRFVDQHHQLPHRPITTHQLLHQTPTHRMRRQARERRRVGHRRLRGHAPHTLNGTHPRTINQTRLIDIWSSDTTERQQVTLAWMLAKSPASRVRSGHAALAVPPIEEFSTLLSISSRMVRTTSSGCPAGSSSFQSS